MVLMSSMSDSFSVLFTTECLMKDIGLITGYMGVALGTRIQCCMRDACRYYIRPVARRGVRGVSQPPPDESEVHFCPLRIN